MLPFLPAWFKKFHIGKDNFLMHSHLKTENHHE